MKWKQGLFCLLLFCMPLLAEHSLNFLRNSEGKIVYLHLNGKDEIESFIAQKDSLAPQLALISIRITGNNYKNLLNPMLSALKPHISGVEELIISSDPTGKGELDNSDLLSVCRIFSTANLKTFRWEFQKDIKEKTLLIQLPRMDKLWATVETLSFRGTKMDDDVFFITLLPFQQLRSLDLSGCNINNTIFEQLISSAEKFPKLESLFLDKSDINVKKLAENPVAQSGAFSALHTVSMYDQDFHFDDYIQLLNGHLWLFSPLKQLFINNFSKKEKLGKTILSPPGIAHSGDFEYTNAGVFAKTNEQIFSTIPAFQANSIFSGGFKRIAYLTDPNISAADRASAGKLGWFFSSRYEIELIPDSLAAKLTSITLASPDIETADVEYLLAMPKFAAVQNIYLANTNINNVELFELREKFADNQHSFHTINVNALGLSSNAFQFDMHWMNHHMLFQQTMPKPPVFGR